MEPFDPARSERDLRALEVDDSLRPITYDLIRAYRNEGFDWPPRWDKVY